jgi:hypothetical protein
MLAVRISQELIKNVLLTGKPVSIYLLDEPSRLVMSIYSLA